MGMGNEDKVAVMGIDMRGPGRLVEHEIRGKPVEIVSCLRSSSNTGICGELRECTVFWHEESCHRVFLGVGWL